MVEISGLEPLTSALQGQRSTTELYPLWFQRVSVETFCLMRSKSFYRNLLPVVGYAGFEPATSPLSGVRSNQLS